MNASGSALRAACEAERALRPNAGVQRGHGVARCRAILVLALALACALPGAPLLGAQFERDRYYWYLPEHEKYGRSEFYAEPKFNSLQVQIGNKQRFRLLEVHRGWATLEFEGGTRAYMHMRILNGLLRDPGATDSWHEFQRASVFDQDPDKLEKELRAAAGEPAATRSRQPAWKRPKEGWGQQSASSPDESDPPAGVSRRNKYPLLPPIVPPIGGESARGGTSRGPATP
jgi:hypothetical protein